MTTKEILAELEDAKAEMRATKRRIEAEREWYDTHRANWLYWFRKLQEVNQF